MSSFQARESDGAKEYFGTGFSFDKIPTPFVTGTKSTFGQMKKMLEMVKAGYGNGEIAATLGIKRKTVWRRLIVIQRFGALPAIKCRYCSLPRSHRGRHKRGL
jgi:hypothetical protein